MKDPEAVAFMHRVFKGAWRQSGEYFVWSLNGRSSTPFLQAILPYLKLKRRIQNAKLCIRFNQGLGKQGKPISNKEQARREKLWSMVSKRNIK